MPVAALKSVVSSQVSHEPHGVGPPAQFRTVPLRLAAVPRYSPDFWSNSTVVVPPAAPRS